MKLIIVINDNDYDLLNNTGITLDWNTVLRGKEKDRELTFATFNLVKALENGTPYEERPQGKWVFKQHGKYVDMCCSVCGKIRYRNIAYNYTVKEVKKSLDGDFYDNFCLYCGADMRG